MCVRPSRAHKEWQAWAELWKKCKRHSSTNDITDDGTDQPAQQRLESHVLEIYGILLWNAFLTCSIFQPSGTGSCALGQTLRLKLIAVYYAPFFLIPLRLLTFSVFRTYDTSAKDGSRSRASSDASATVPAAAVNDVVNQSENHKPVDEDAKTEKKIN